MTNEVSSQPPQLSVVIPTIDEQAELPALLAQLNKQRDVSLEILVADGGSVDDTAAIAEQHGATIIRSEPGRGLQMNRAAAAARGEWLLFLHADSRLTQPRQLKDALARLAEELSARGNAVSTSVVAGHFPLQFVGAHAPAEFKYRYLQLKTELNRPNTINGDQAVLIRRCDFHRLGGFDQSLPFLEDQRFAERLSRDGQWITLDDRLQTSSRRFSAEGFSRRYTLMSIIMGMYAVSAEAFFRQAGGVYNNQKHAKRLALAPFIALSWRVLKTLPWRQRLGIGRFIAQNAWQLGLMVEVRLRPSLGCSKPGAKPSRWLRFYDRYLAGFFASTAVAALTTLLAALWFFLVLWPYYAVTDSGE